MRLRVLAILTVLIHFTAASISRSFGGTENEALLVRCPREGSYKYPVEWYYSNTNRSVTTQKGNRVFAGGEYLKLLPAKVEDSGVYTCIVRSSTFVKTGHVNVTIYKKQPGCKIPNRLIYSKIFGSEKNSKIYCPTITRYNWTAPVEWFKNCKVLQGPRYYIQEAYLLIDNATNEDTGDYTCKFMHNENGVSYNVTATRSFAFHKDDSFSMFPEIIAPPQNEIRDVEVGKAVNITCSACFGKGPQFMTPVVWQVNGTNVSKFSEARIWQEQEQEQKQNQRYFHIEVETPPWPPTQLQLQNSIGVNSGLLSSSSALTCRSTVLRIAAVREEDLQLRYDCKALNLHGVRSRSLRLRRKKPIDRQSTYYMLAGFGILFMLINIMVIMLKVFWIEVILLWRDVARPYKARNDGKIYDAYVIYPRTHKDSPEGTCSVEYFVHQVLPDVLENKCGYSLCIYGRDLLPGEDVAMAVETNIRKSRRHIFVLAPGAAHSEDLAYEQEVALHSALVQGDAKAILIEVLAPGGLQLAGLPRSLQHLVQVQGTIKWREDHVANKRSLNSKFWKRVRYHMPVPSKPPCAQQASLQDGPLGSLNGRPDVRMLRCCTWDRPQPSGVGVGGAGRGGG